MMSDYYYVAGKRDLKDDLIENAEKTAKKIINKVGWWENGFDYEEAVEIAKEILIKEIEDEN